MLYVALLTEGLSQFYNYQINSRCNFGKYNFTYIYAVINTSTTVNLKSNKNFDTPEIHTKEHFTVRNTSIFI